jgi:hypothetical protein
MNLLRLYLRNHFIHGLIFGLIIAIMAIIGSLINPGIISLKASIISALLIFIPIGIFTTSFLFWYVEIYTPKKMSKTLKNKSFVKFIQMGFIEKESFLEGNYKEYYCRIWWSPYTPLNSNRSSINLFISCNLSKFQLEKLTEMYKKEKLIWNENGVLGFVPILIKTPKHEKLKNKLDRIIQILNQKNIKSKEFENEITTANTVQN